MDVASKTTIAQNCKLLVKNKTNKEVTIMQLTSMQNTEFIFEIKEWLYTVELALIAFIDNLRLRTAKTKPITAKRIANEPNTSGAIERKRIMFAIKATRV